MNNMRHYIVVDMGYCCEYAFFLKYKRTSSIAARLGVSDRTVRRHKELFNCGVIDCEGKCNCMKYAIKELKKC